MLKVEVIQLGTEAPRARGGRTSRTRLPAEKEKPAAQKAEGWGDGGRVASSRARKRSI